MSLSQGNMMGRKRMKGKDPMGGWVYTKYATTNKRVLMLKQQNRTEDPRKALIKDLLKQLKVGHDKGDHFIIG
eukprot:2342812-Ditylum_brightwellii.AAC.1